MIQAKEKEKYLFLVNDLSHSWKTVSESYLFNDYVHLITQPCPGLYFFELADLKKKKIVARSAFFIENESAFSPYRGSFGGIEFFGPLSFAEAAYFIREILLFLDGKNVRRILLTSFPFAYAPENNALLTQLLLNEGFKISRSEINQHLVVHQPSLIPLLHLSAKRKYLKCLKAGFIFEEWPQPDLTFVYAFVKDHRMRKNFPVSLDFQSFEMFFQRFPQNYKVFRVKKGHEIAALSAVVRINSQILYNFYPADHPAYLSNSPLIFLNVGLYLYAKENAYQLLDLGVSSVQGKVNEGLFRFKSNLGALPSLKLTFLKENTL